MAKLWIWQMNINQEVGCNGNKNTFFWHGTIMMHCISTSKFDKIVDHTIFASMKSHENDTLISLVLQTNA
jgi:hypothetical protein